MAQKTKKLDARVVANKLIKLGAENDNALTPLQVIKLTYYCHGWHLGIYKKPLVRQQVEAWDHGPVIADVYHALKHWGMSPVRNEIFIEESYKETEAQKKLIYKVYKEYGTLSGWNLSSRTHNVGTPWHDVVYVQQNRSGVISNRAIRRYFKRIMEN